MRGGRGGGAAGEGARGGIGACGAHGGRALCGASWCGIDAGRVLGGLKSVGDEIRIRAEGSGVSRSY